MNLNKEFVVISDLGGCFIILYSEIKSIFVFEKRSLSRNRSFYFSLSLVYRVEIINGAVCECTFM